MRITSIALARAIGYIETLDLDPRGRIFYPALVGAIIQRYQFQGFPQKPEEFDEAKGIKFTDGKWEDLAIQQFTVYNTGLLVDTRSSTQDSRKLLESTLEWCRDSFGITYRPEMLKRWAYISNIVLESDVSLTAIHPAMENLARGLKEGVESYTDRHLPYELVSFNLNVDLQQVKYPLVNFMLSRRADAPLLENRYFSEAPLPTDQHIKLLEQFEADLKARMR